jgi:hypothetical protein
MMNSPRRPAALSLGGAVIAMALAASFSPPPVGAAAAESNLFERTDWPTPETKVDRYVFRRLAKLGLQPAACSDAVFLRRAHLDVIGTLPTAAEVRAFLQDRDPGKRTALVDRLLARPEYADCWAMKWSDLLRVKAEFPVNLWPNAAQAYHHWIRTAVRDNLPYDQFVREMLTANGSNFRVGPVNFYRALQNRTPEGIAGAVALTFMGTRVDAWPTNKLSGLASFFSQVGYKPTREWKEEIVFWDPDKDLAAALTNVPPPASTNAAPLATNAVAAVAQPAEPVRTGPLVAVFPDGGKVKLAGDRDPREVFADWLITPKNPWFARSLVNRAWSWLMGRGIIHEPDDIRPDNPPVNPELLAYLQKEFVASGYDMKRLFRLILTSRAYQCSALKPAVVRPEAEANFAYYPLRQLDAEVLIDALNKITGSTELYTSPIPEPFTFIPENKPAIALPDGSITSPFLELFGRPARATGMENERANRPSPPQQMYLLNSVQIQRKVAEGPALRDLIGQNRPPREVIEDLYLTILSRFPTEAEVEHVLAYVKAGVAKGREAALDLAWALMNTDEFRMKH